MRRTGPYGGGKTSKGKGQFPEGLPRGALWADQDEGEEEEDKKEEEPKFVKQEVSQDADKNEILWWDPPTGIEVNLPLGLLAAKRGKATSGDIKLSKEIISFIKL